MPVGTELVAARYPRLYNVAYVDAWPSIKRHGLLSTTALLNLFEVEGDAREALESRRRPETVTLRHPAHGTAVIRDQLPLNEARLSGLLTDMTPRRWYEALNRRVFFWPTRGRLIRMLEAPPYRDREHLVLTLDTAALLRNHARRVELSAINSGSTLFRAHRRGSATFLPLEEYPFEERWRRYYARGAVAELTVCGAVPDALELSLTVEVRRGPRIQRTLTR